MDDLPTPLQRGDPYSRLKRIVPDAETLDRLLAPIAESDKPWVRAEAIAAMMAEELGPAVLLADRRWRCSRRAFGIWIRKLSRDTGWTLPAFWADEPIPSVTPTTPPETDKPTPSALRQIVIALERYSGGDGGGAPKSMKEALSRVRELMTSNGLDRLPPYTAAKKIEEYATLNGFAVPKDSKTIVKHINMALTSEQ